VTPGQDRAARDRTNPLNAAVPDPPPPLDAASPPGPGLPYPHMRGIIAGFVLALVAAAPAGAQTVGVYPSSGTISASPTTQVSFRGVTAAQLGRIVVRGSRTGTHSGRVLAHSDGQGVSWLPSHRFSVGETVTVTTALTAARTRFRILKPPGRITLPNRILENINAGATRHFRSRPDLTPPLVTVDHGRKPTAPGLVFLSAKSKKDQKQNGPMIVDNAGKLIWFRPLAGIGAATDFRAQTYQGKPVLTYWQGTSRQGIGTGQLVILDQTYKPIRRIRIANGFRPDLHEFIITPQGTALFITYPIVAADLRGVHGAKRGRVVDSVIQEVDIATGLVVFEWHSLGKIALAESFSRPAPSARVPFDYAHANSVDLDGDGTIILSARNTWTIYKIDRATGAIRWRLGGKHSSFKLGAGAHFAWQHDARRRADGALTVFDNSAFPPVRKHSRALALRVDEGARTATLISARTHPRGLLTATQGNQQTLPNGDALVGWGSQRYFTEFAPDGGVLWDARLSVGYETYRAYRMPWVGRPFTTPRAAAVRLRGGGMNVYASWNGATEVAAWQVLAGASPTGLIAIGSAPHAGFETRIPVTAGAPYVAVRALDAGGGVLGTSPPRRVG
jgi:hypothetical protein